VLIQKHKERLGALKEHKLLQIPKRWERYGVRQRQLLVGSTAPHPAAFTPALLKVTFKHWLYQPNQYQFTSKEMSNQSSLSALGFVLSL